MKSAYGDFTPPTSEQIAALVKTDLPKTESRGLAMHDVRSGRIDKWFVCRAPQDASAARLLDVAVALRDSESEKLPCVAILQPPKGNEKQLGDVAAYLRKYQGIVWHAFGVAFVLDADELAFAPESVKPSREQEGLQFDKLVQEVFEALRDDALTASSGDTWMLPADSREAEALVRLTMNRVLKKKGYRRKLEKRDEALDKHYQGFWRRAEADGIWSCKGAPIPNVALEAKLDEDARWPLCQPVDHLAHVANNGGGGVIYVRVHRPGHEPKEHTPMMDRLESAALVKYLDVKLG